MEGDKGGLAHAAVDGEHEEMRGGRVSSLGSLSARTHGGHSLRRAARLLQFLVAPLQRRTARAEPQRRAARNGVGVCAGGRMAIARRARFVPASGLGGIAGADSDFRPRYLLPDSNSSYPNYLCYYLTPCTDKMASFLLSGIRSWTD